MPAPHQLPFSGNTASISIVGDHSFPTLSPCGSAEIVSSPMFGPWPKSNNEVGIPVLRQQWLVQEWASDSRWTNQNPVQDFCYICWERDSLFLEIAELVTCKPGLSGVYHVGRACLKMTSTQRKANLRGGENKSWWHHLNAWITSTWS